MPNELCIISLLCTALPMLGNSAMGRSHGFWERNIFRSADAGASWERLDVSLPEGSRVNEMCALVVAEM